MSPFAQLAQAAPLAPPQDLGAQESVLGAVLLSPGASGAVGETEPEEADGRVRLHGLATRRS